MPDVNGVDKTTGKACEEINCEDGIKMELSFTEFKTGVIDFKFLSPFEISVGNSHSVFSVTLL
jgi:hypothetical protein